MLATTGSCLMYSRGEEITLLWTWKNKARWIKGTQKSELIFAALPGFPHWLPWSTHPQPFSYESLPGHLWNRRKNLFRPVFLKLHRFVPGKVVTYKCSKKRNPEHRQWDFAPLHSPKGTKQSPWSFPTPNLFLHHATCKLPSLLVSTGIITNILGIRGSHVSLPTLITTEKTRKQKYSNLTKQKKQMTNYYIL